MSCPGCDSCAHTSADRSTPAYELHLTVRPGSMRNLEWACEVLGLRLLVIDLHGSAPVHYQQVMTSQTVRWEPWGEALRRAARGLTLVGLRPLRMKVEAAPWCPEVPTRENGREPGPEQYMEGHVLVECPPERYTELGATCRAHGFHLSSSPFKPGRYYATARHATAVHEDFSRQCDMFRWVLEDGAGFRVVKSFTEFTIMDTARDLDGEWGR